MKSLALGIKRFLQDEDGVTMVEYGLLAALIAIVCIVAIRTVGDNLSDIFTRIGNCLSQAGCPNP